MSNGQQTQKTTLNGTMNKKKTRYNKDLIITILAILVVILGARVYYLSQSGPIIERNYGELSADEQTFLDAYFEKFKNPQYEAFNNFEGIPQNMFEFC
jgi:hypothetical protein